MAFSYDFTAMADGAFSDANLDLQGTGFTITSGRLQKASSDATYSYLTYNQSITDDVIEATITLQEAPDYQAVIATIVDPATGNGYQLRVRYGQFMYFDRIANWVIANQADFESSQTFAAGDTFTLRVDRSTATNNVDLIHNSTTEGTYSDGTYTANLAPGIGKYQENANVGFAAFSSINGGAAGREITSLTGALRRGNTGVTANCSGLDANPTTQTVEIDTGTYIDSCTVTDWNGGSPVFTVDCDLPPGTNYTLRITDDQGTVTLTGQTLLIESDRDNVVYDGTPTPAGQESLGNEWLADHGVTAATDDQYGIVQHAAVTWNSAGQAVINPLQTVSVAYWAWDDSAGAMYTGTITIAEEAVLSNQTLTSTGSTTMQATVDTTVNTGSAYGFCSTSATPPSEEDLESGVGSADHDVVPVTAAGTLTFNFSGLSPSTTHYVHILHNNSGAQSTIVTTGGVATDSAPANMQPVIDPQIFYGLEGAAGGEYIDLGNLTDARVSDETVTDFEGIVRTIPAGTPLREGCRVVIPIADDPVGWDAFDVTTWTLSGSTTTPDYRTIDFTASAGDRAISHYITDGAYVGRTFRYTVRLSGTPGDVVRVQLQDLTTWDSTVSTVTLSDAEQDYTVIRTVAAGATGVQARIANDDVGIAKTVYCTGCMLEDVTGQANQNPSTITAELAYSDYKNGNTVVNDVVVPGVGARFKGTADYIKELIDNENYSVVNDAGTDYWVNGGTPNTSPRYSLHYENGGLVAAAEATIVRSGTGSVRFEIQTNQSAHASNRSEMRISDYKSIFNTNVFKFSVYFPVGFSWPDGWFVFWQLRQHDSTASPIVEMTLTATGLLRVLYRNESSHVGGAYEAYISPSSIELGQWIDFKLRVTGDVNNSGDLSVWKKLSADSVYTNLVDLNDVSIGYETYDGTTQDPNQYCECKFGLYREGSDLGHIAYFDDIEQYSIDPYWLHDNAKNTELRITNPFPHNEGSVVLDCAFMYDMGDVINERVVWLGSGGTGPIYLNSDGSIRASDGTNYPAGLSGVTYVSGDKMLAASSWGSAGLDVTAKNVSDDSAWGEASSAYDGAFDNDATDIIHLFKWHVGAVRLYGLDLYSTKYTPAQIQAGLVDPDTYNLPATIGQSIGTVAASDPDLDTLTYSITAGNTDGDVAIDPDTGELTWFHAPDPTRTPTYNLTVQVSDGELTASAAVTINVLAVSSGGDSEDGFICSIIKSLIQPLIKDVIN